MRARFAIKKCYSAFFHFKILLLMFSFFHLIFSFIKNAFKFAYIYQIVIPEHFCQNAHFKCALILKILKNSNNLKILSSVETVFFLLFLAIIVIMCIFLSFANVHITILVKFQSKPCPHNKCPNLK